MDNFGWVQVNSNDSSIMECEAFKRANMTKAQEFESKMEFSVEHMLLCHLIQRTKIRAKKEKVKEKCVQFLYID